MGALKRLKGEICHGADRGRKWHGLLLPGGSILLTYSVPMRPFTHSLNAPPHTHIQNPPISFFIFSKFLWLCSNIDIKKKKKRPPAPEPGLGWKAPSRSAQGELSGQPREKKKKKDYKVLLQWQYSREVTQWQTCCLNVCSSVATARVRGFSPGGFDFM